MFIYPDIVEQFGCRMCGDCCRRSWLVTVDEAAYGRNRQLFEKMGMEGEFDAAFQRIQGPASPGEYAVIGKGADGACRFLDGDNLCMLHKMAGHGHLDQVCQTFPRYPMNSARGCELTLAFSCPAVLQLVERVEPLRFVRSDEAPCSVAQDSFVEHVFPRQKRQADPLYYYFEIEQHFIDILQNRNASLAERLVFLGKTAEEIAGLACEDSPGQRLNGIFAKNYRWFDETGETAPAEGLTAEIIMEHYLVNIVFKKIVYTYGLQKGLRILEKFHRFLRLALSAARDTTDSLDLVRQAVRELEFRFGHHRSSLGEL